jgi:hypothetical protein
MLKSTVNAVMLAGVIILVSSVGAIALRLYSLAARVSLGLRRPVVTGER